MTSTDAGDEPAWLRWSRELRAIAQSGLAFTKDPYDRERFERIRAIAAETISVFARVPFAEAEAAFAFEAGYATPKVDVRGAAFDEAGRILMVRETMDGGRWTLPGGWADVNQTASECVEREIREESGFETRAVKLALVHDRARQGHRPAGPFSIYKLFFICEVVGGKATASLETSGTAFFAEDDLPSDLSTGRTLPHQLAKLFAHRRDPGRPTEFD